VYSDLGKIGDFQGFYLQKYQWLIVVYTMLYLLLVSDVEDTLN
jgi:hypothetical protein